MTTTYEITTADNANRLLGTLIFDAENNATLELKGHGPDYDQLQARWEGIYAKESLTVRRRTREKDENGNWVYFEGFHQIGKDSPDYPPAVVQFMGYEYGYVLSIQPGRYD